MAINRALMKRQMYDMGGPTLQAGAPDLRLTGNQNHRGTYTQRRRNQMAGGGITQIGKPGGLVESGISKYGALDFITKPLEKLKDKIVDDIIPNEIKENPMATALVGGALLNQFGLPSIPGLDTKGMGQNWLGDLLGGVMPGDTQFNTVLGDSLPFRTDIASIDDLNKYLTTGGYFGPSGGNVLDEFGTAGKTGMESGISIADILKNQGLKGVTSAISSSLGIPSIISQLPQEIQQAILQQNMGNQQQTSAYDAQGRPKIEWQKPLAIGLGIGAADAATRKDYQLPEDLSINIPQTAQAAIDDPNLRFKPIESARLADGGRIGYQNAGPVDIPENLPTDNYLRQLEEFLRRREEYDRKIRMAPKQEAAQGGRIGAQEGGLMNLGGMEKDYRQEGGFVPIGGQEKADDVPARLSKNEFVFTADAVRAAGGGDIDEGAAVMERLMENLEAGGKVSEDSQGLEGAREMFATAQELEKRII